MAQVNGTGSFAANGPTPMANGETTTTASKMGRSSGSRVERLRNGGRGNLMRCKMDLSQQAFVKLLADLDRQVISNPVAADVENHYRGTTIEEVIYGRLVYMNDGGYTRWFARLDDTYGWSLNRISTCRRTTGIRTWRFATLARAARCRSWYTSKAHLCIVRK